MTLFEQTEDGSLSKYVCTYTHQISSVSLERRPCCPCGKKLPFCPPLRTPGPCPAGRDHTITAVTIGVTTHPLDRFLELDYSATKRLPTPTDTFPNSYMDEICLSTATFLGTDSLLVVE